MASLLQKIIRKQSAARIITSYNKPQSPNLTTSLLNHLHHQSHLIEHKPLDPHSIFLTPSLGPPITGYSTPPHPLQFYPSFSFGFFLNPISSTGFVQSEADDFVSGDTTTIWADSVKKKRKKKMNKHKLKKLRKRLRQRG